MKIAAVNRLLSKRCGCSCALEPTVFWIYLLVDEQGDLVYVGMSDNPRGRALQHRKTKRFHSVWLCFPPFPKRIDAEVQEEKLIGIFQPIYNEEHNPAPRPELAAAHRMGLAVVLPEPNLRRRKGAEPDDPPPPFARAMRVA